MASVPRNLWLPSLRRRQELLSSALACVQNVLRHCMQTKSDCMLLRSHVVSWVLALGSFPIKRQLCFDFPRSKTCTSPLTWVLYVRQDAPEVATVIRTIKLTLKQKNLLPSDVLEIEKNKISRSEEALPIRLQLQITWTNRLSWRKPAAFNFAEDQV